MIEDVKYVYAVISSGEAASFGPIGIGERGDEVHTVPHEDLAAVVSDCPFIDYTAMKDGDKEKIARDLAAHRCVIEEVMKGFATLPMKFGTMVKDEHEVKTILQQGHLTLKEALATVQDKVQMEVVATWDLASVMSEIAQDEPIAKLKAKIEEQPRLRCIAHRIELGKMVCQSLDRRREHYQEEILEALSGYALDVQKKPLANATMAMNVALLINGDQQEEFDGKVKEMDRRLAGALNFKITGPLLPHSFSSVEVKLFTPQEIEEARELLGLDGEGSLSEIDTAYYQLVQEYHPHLKAGDEEMEELFAHIAGAYQLLSSYCLGEAAAQGVTADGEVRGHRCSFSPATVDRITLVAIERSGNTMSKSQSPVERFWTNTLLEHGDKGGAAKLMARG